MEAHAGPSTSTQQSSSSTTKSLETWLRLDYKHGVFNATLDDVTEWVGGKPKKMTQAAVSGRRVKVGTSLCTVIGIAGSEEELAVLCEPLPDKAATKSPLGAKRCRRAPKKLDPVDYSTDKTKKANKENEATSKDQKKKEKETRIKIKNQKEFTKKGTQDKLMEKLPSSPDWESSSPMVIALKQQLKDAHKQLGQYKKKAKKNDAVDAKDEAEVLTSDSESENVSDSDTPYSPSDTSDSDEDCEDGNTHVQTNLRHPRHAFGSKEGVKKCRSYGMQPTEQLEDEDLMDENSTRQDGGPENGATREDDEVPRELEDALQEELAAPLSPIEAGDSYGQDAHPQGHAGEPQGQDDGQPQVPDGHQNGQDDGHPQGHAGEPQGQDGHPQGHAGEPQGQDGHPQGHDAHQNGQPEDQEVAGAGMHLAEEIELNRLRTAIRNILRSNPKSQLVKLAERDMRNVFVYVDGKVKVAQCAERAALQRAATPGDAVKNILLAIFNLAALVHCTLRGTERSLPPNAVRGERTKLYEMGVKAIPEVLKKLKALVDRENISKKTYFEDRAANTADSLDPFVPPPTKKGRGKPKKFHQDGRIEPLRFIEDWTDDAIRDSTVDKYIQQRCNYLRKKYETDVAMLTKMLDSLENE